MKLWGGRFDKKTDKLVEGYTSSLPFDKRLYPEDIKVNEAHAKMLNKINLINDEETDMIVGALKEIKKEMDAGEFIFEESDEDIHTAIERNLIDRLGAVGGKLRTARSRNDQAVTDLKLYMKKEIKNILELVLCLQKTLIKRAKENDEIVMPGYTHLQKAQPILLAHYFMAYFFMFERDKDRLKNCLKMLDKLPLGSGALAGTSFRIDRKFVAKKLGFIGVVENSLDAVSDRDFVIEFIAAASIMIMHLSRFSEELVIWCTSEFGFIEMDEAYATGSSIMPQKKNPDVAEIVRSKTGRIYGDLQSVLTMMKGLPLAYNRDMQEDKEALFDVVDTLEYSLKVFDGMIDTMVINGSQMYKATDDDFITATDVADYLAAKGMPFKQAHEVVGNIVKHCIGKGMDLTDMKLDDFIDFSSLFGRDIIDIIRPRRSVERRSSTGGTSPVQVNKQIKIAETLIKSSG